MVFSWKRAFGFAALHFAISRGLEFLIFLLAHLPPTLGGLDPVIVFGNAIQRVLLFPKHLLRAMIPLAANTFGLNWTLTLATSLLWGLLLARMFRKTPATTLLE